MRLCIQKYRKGGVKAALSDAERSGQPTEITDDALAWIIHIACQRPADPGYSQELWTLKNLHRHIQDHASEAGFPRLETISKACVGQLLKGIRVKSKEELMERIYKYFDEINAKPVIYHWKYKMDEISQDDVVGI